MNLRTTQAVFESDTFAALLQVERHINIQDGQTAACKETCGKLGLGCVPDSELSVDKFKRHLSTESSCFVHLFIPMIKIYIGSSVSQKQNPIHDP